MTLETLKSALNKRPLAQSQIRKLFAVLDENGWKRIQGEFFGSKEEIVEMFCRSIGEKDETQ